MSRRRIAGSLNIGDIDGQDLSVLDNRLTVNDDALNIVPRHCMDQELEWVVDGHRLRRVGHRRGLRDVAQ